MKIQDMRPKTTSGGYERVFNNQELGDLITKIQATVISNGTELERIVLSQSKVIDDVDAFIDDVTYGRQREGVFVAPKKCVKKSWRTIPGIEPDFIIFIVEKNRICKIVELKDGYMFDTKKVKGEKENLETFTEKFGSKIPFVTEWYICCFNEDDKSIIKEGLKNEFDESHILTGREFCKILNINYDSIIEQRKNDGIENLQFFISEMLAIDNVADIIKKQLS
jgi:hypothetical protein